MLSTALKTVSRFSRDDLHAYQERAVDFIKETPSCALWVDMGLGKTVSTLTAVADLLDSFEVGRVLVIAPLRVAIHTWPEEIQRWQHTQHLSMNRIAGSPKQRLNVLQNDRSDIHIINRELVPWLVEQTGKDWPYDMVVIDEASSFKSSKAKRFKALRKMLPFISRLIELTGTPASNGLLGVWSQIFLLDRGERLGKTFGGYQRRHFVSDFHGYTWTLRKDADDEIYDKLKDVCLTLSAADYLELPERVDTTIAVDIPDAAREQYRQLERDFLLEVGDDEIVEVLHAAALSNKLLQFANGAIYIDEEKNWIEVHDAKLAAMSDLVDETAGQPLLVAYNYKTDLARLLKRFPQAEVIGTNPKTIERWNAGGIPMLLAHPASAGHGLNLQHGGNNVVWFGLNWSLELYLQFNARLDRQGQTKPVVVHHIVSENTIDDTVLAALATKDATQRALLNALKADIGGRS
ncbi:MAG: DEAD/DEAH box helicase [Blastopirellula sp.]|nr:MAG: DEAD/DEAH box helicase [Blastopirellula sp.]